MRNKFAETFFELGQADQDLCLLVADISPAGSIQKFREAYPARFINTGVAEQVMIGMAAGMAQRGLKPFCYTIATFAFYRPFEFIRDDLAYQNLPVTVIGIGGGVSYSTLGATHHAMEDVAIACTVPNLRVIAPCDPLEVEAATRWCAHNDGGPVYMRLGKAGEPVLTAKTPEPWEFGKIRWIYASTAYAEEKALAILSYGPIMSKAVALADWWAKEEGLTVDVYSVHTLKPLDRSRLHHILLHYKRVAVIEECVAHGGLGMKVRSFAHSCGLDDVVISTHHLQDQFFHAYGDHEYLLTKHCLSLDHLKIDLQEMFINGD